MSLGLAFLCIACAVVRFSLLRVFSTQQSLFADSIHIPLFRPIAFHKKCLAGILYCHNVFIGQLHTRKGFATCLVNYEFAHILKCLDLTDQKQYGWRKNELVKYLMLLMLLQLVFASTSQVCLLLFIDDPSASFRFTRIN